MKALRKAPGQSLEKAEHKLFEAIACLKNSAETRRFFQDLCTPAELQAMADRWKVVEALKVGKSYRHICDETGVSVTTIGRVARCILLGESGYNVVYERLKKGK